MIAVRQYWTCMLLAALVGLVSCAQNLVNPETLQERLAYAEGTLTATYLTIADMKFLGRISAEKRDELVKDADAAGATLDATRAALGAGDLTTASAKLQLAQDALRLLQTTLRGFQ
jgi:hypothetical protein